MSINQMPPQAYTRETLAKAYLWLRAQSNEVKEMAQSADALVNLYLRAQRHDDPHDRPSMQSFKSELKNLAGMMGEFEEQSPIRVSSQQMLSQPQNSEVLRAQSSEQTKTNLDMKSYQMIQEVKTQFNLSSDTEALRLLIAIGYSKIKNSL